MDRLAPYSQSAFLSEADCEWRCIVTEEADEQDFEVIQQTGRALSAQGATVISVLNHDDDILIMSCFKDGKILAHFNSDPGYFDADGDGTALLQGAEVFAQIGSGVSEKVLRSLLVPENEDDEFVFAYELHDDIVKLLGLPNCSVGAGYRDVSSGERPEQWQKLALQRS